MKKILLPLCLLAIMSAESFASKEAIYTKNAPEPIGIYSQAIRVDNTIYISGQIPVDPTTGEIVKGSFKDQVKQVFSNIHAITKAADGNLDDIVKVTVYLTDLSNFSVLNDVMMELFHKPYPARVTIEIKALPKMH